MCFFKKKKAVQKEAAAALTVSGNQDEMMQSSIKRMNALKVRLEGQPALSKMLGSAQNVYGFMIADGKPATVKADNIISDTLREIELSLRKCEETKNYSEVEALIRKLKTTLADR